MTYKEALKQLRKVGTAHAHGDALCAMYADLVAFQQGGANDKYYSYLQEATTTDEEIRQKALPLLRSRAAAWDVLMEVGS